MIYYGRVPLKIALLRLLWVQLPSFKYLQLPSVLELLESVIFDIIDKLIMLYIFFLFAPCLWFLNESVYALGWQLKKLYSYRKLTTIQWPSLSQWNPFQFAALIGQFGSGSSAWEARRTVGATILKIYFKGAFDFTFYSWKCQRFQHFYLLVYFDYINILKNQFT